MRLTRIEVDPRPLAVARVGVAFAAVMNAFEVRRILLKLAEGRLSMPTVVPMPPPTETRVTLWLFVAVAAGTMLAVGWRARAAAAILTAHGIVTLMWDMQAYSNHVLLTTLLAAYLTFSRSDEAWSLNAWLRIRRDYRPVPWWPQMLMMTQLSACYLFAGLSKLNLWWLTGWVLERSLWWPLPEIAFRVMALAAVVAEIFMAVGLWIRGARRIAVLLGLLLHLGIVTLVRDPLPLIAFAMLCVSLYPMFLTRPPTDHRA